MIKGKRLHDMMCSVSDTYLQLYANKSLGDKLKQELSRPNKIPFPDGVKVVSDIIHEHLIKKGFV